MGRRKRRIIKTFKKTLPKVYTCPKCGMTSIRVFIEDNLIKISSMKSRPDEIYHKFLNLNDFLQQELWFLSTNLYFKHSVRTELKFQDNPPLISNLPKDSMLALSWFLQAIIEELEGQEIQAMILRTSFSDSYLEITITTEDRNLSEKFIELLNQEISTSSLNIENNDVGMILALMIFEAGGASITSQTDPPGSNITLAMPIEK